LREQYEKLSKDFDWVIKENNKFKEELKDKYNEVKYQEDIIKFFNMSTKSFLGYNMYKLKVRKKGGKKKGQYMIFEDTLDAKVLYKRM